MSIPCEYKSFGCRVEIHFKDKEMVSTRAVPYSCKCRRCSCQYVDESCWRQNTFLRHYLLENSFFYFKINFLIIFWNFFPFLFESHVYFFWVKLRNYFCPKSKKFGLNFIPVFLYKKRQCCFLIKKLNFSSVFQHERVCKFRPFICPYIECDHKLAADAVVTHVSTAHRWTFLG